MRRARRMALCLALVAVTVVGTVAGCGVKGDPARPEVGFEFDGEAAFGIAG